MSDGFDNEREVTPTASHVYTYVREGRTEDGDVVRYRKRSIARCAWSAHTMNVLIAVDGFYLRIVLTS